MENFDYSSPFYLEVLRQLIQDYKANLIRNTPSNDMKESNEEMIKIREDIEQFLISYSLSDNFHTTLNRQTVSMIWDTFRNDQMSNVFAFINHLTIRMRLIYTRDRWDTLIKDIAFAYALRGDIQKVGNEIFKQNEPFEIDEDMAAQLSTEETIYHLFRRNPWLVILCMIVLLRG